MQIALLMEWVHWYAGTLVHWFTGSLGTLVHWFTGSLVHGSLETLDPLDPTDSLQIQSNPYLR